jgi:hypothetical protein
VANGREGSNRKDKKYRREERTNPPSPLNIKM